MMDDATTKKLSEIAQDLINLSNKLGQIDTTNLTEIQDELLTKADKSILDARVAIRKVLNSATAVS